MSSDGVRWVIEIGVAHSDVRRCSCHTEPDLGPFHFLCSRQRLQIGTSHSDMNRGHILVTTFGMPTVLKGNRNSNYSEKPVEKER